MVAAVTPGDAGALRRDRLHGRLALGGPGHARQHRRVHARRPRTAWRRSAAPRTGKAIIILNPAEPPILMRNTVYCALPAGADRARDRARRSRPMAAEVAGLRARLPRQGHRLRRGPVRARPAASRPARVSIFLEVTGNGDYLPPYAGNLDIMTASAVRVGETLASERFACAGGRDGEPGMSDRPERRVTRRAAAPTGSPIRRCATARTRSPTSSPPSRSPRSPPRSTRAGVPVIEVSHGDGLGGTRSTTASRSSDERDLIARGRRLP